MSSGENDIAIVGMAAHLPGARDVREFWRNLADGVESIRQYSEEELAAAGLSLSTLRQPNYIKSGGVIDDVENFDAEFFGFSPKEAAIMDPQHRHFLECAWEAFEDAGHPPERFAGAIGVFCGCGMGSYFIFNLLSNPELVKSVGLFLLRHTGNDKDFLATRVSYLFNLKGPSINVQTACSTSLVAVHLACQSLLTGECDMALAGGVTIEVPHRRGYFYHEGEVLSADGHCRAFDHRSSGTVLTSGAGVVLLRRAADAIADGDTIYAIIRGSAVNNDGSGKVGYLAPSVDGQAAAMAEALAVAGVEPESLSYIECHGTGTFVGDPIEMSAMTEAYATEAFAPQSCAIGSVKSSIGHLDTAAGVASLIKTALALTHRQIPASLNFEAPNPTIDFASSPFFVNTALRPWTPARGAPRRAGINSLGVGGTNAHVIVEEAPAVAPTSPSKRSFQLLRLSARSRAALDAQATRLGQFLKQHPELPIGDVAYTLAIGRRDFAVRRVLACRDTADAAKLLETGDAQRIFTHQVIGQRPQVAFLFPGGSAQYPGMGRELYETEPEFRAQVDRGVDWLRAHHNIDLRPLLFPAPDAMETARSELERTSRQLPAIFIIEQAMAQLWLSWGVTPTALLGHSMGENAAAVLAGVYSFEDGLGLVALRGQLTESVGEGAMLSVPMRADELKALLGPDLDLAIINAPELAVASGSTAAIDALSALLEGRGLEVQRLRIRVAGHSRHLDPILERFRAYMKSLRLKPPQIPLVSNTTGTWLKPEEATDPEYWVRHLRQTIRFSDGVSTLLKEPERVLLEVGPGRMLSSLARQNPAVKPSHSLVPSLRHPDDPVSDVAFFTTSLGRLWASGVTIDENKLWPNERRRRVSLPTYAFQRQRYWIEPGKAPSSAEPQADALLKQVELARWFYAPEWRRAPLESGAATSAAPNQTCLVFLDDAGVGRRLTHELRAAGHDVVTVAPGDAYVQKSVNEYVIAPEHGRDNYDALVRDLLASGRVPTQVVHLWLVTADESFRPGSSFFHRNLERGFYSLFFLAQAFGAEGTTANLRFTVVANGTQRFGTEAPSHPEKTTVLGPVLVMPREFPGLHASLIDVVLPANGSGWRKARAERAAKIERLATQLLAELAAPPADGVFALREDERFLLEYVRRSAAATPPSPAPLPTSGLREGGVYLITGGLGGLGLTMAAYLARETRGARLALLSRSRFPERAAWEGFVKRHGAEHRTSRRILQLMEFESKHGAEILTLCADVTDVEQMRAALAQVEARFGALHGVLHTAGVVRDSLIQAKNQAEIEDVFTPKVHGTLVLDELLATIPLDFYVLFSSTSTVTAPPGQIDYVAANAFLNAYAERRAALFPNTYTVAINWGIWNQVGMAAEALKTGSAIGNNSTASEEPSEHPLFDGRLRQNADTTLYTALYATESHWILNEHRTARGQALLPGTGYLELARAALEGIGEPGAFELRDLYFFRPLYVGDDEQKPVRVKLEREEEGYAFVVQSHVTVEGGQSGWETHAQARLLLHRLSAPARIDVPAIDARLKSYRSAIDTSGIRSPQEDFINFGPRWRVLQQESYGVGEALAVLELPARYRSDLVNFGLHPALLDLATGYAMRLIAGYLPAANGKTGSVVAEPASVGTRTLWVPISYQSVRVLGRLPRRVVSHVRNHGDNRADSEVALFDITIADTDGQVLLEISEFAIRRLAANADFAAAPPPAARDLERDAISADSGNRPLSPAEEALRRNLEQGIAPSEGQEVLGRVLQARRAPHVLVSSIDLDALRQQVRELGTTREATGTKFARPALESEFLAARDDIERTLVSFWEELLGVENIGVKDSFFDLGGHSLIAVRLFARIKKAFQVDYPISILFEAPTIELCANLIREVVGPSAEAAPGATPRATQQHRTRYTHLVPMHPGKGGGKTPFFLVAGMFGNVLNLRHLAHLLGTERPFYGLQARGLYGDHTPHETFEEMAVDYLKELRTVQPHGPYLLGGFSGGGITAFEMAHQLLAEGEKVGTLIMLDSILPEMPQLSRLEKLRIHGMKLRRQGLRYLSDWAVKRWHWELRRFQRRSVETEEERAPGAFRSDLIEAAFRAALPRYRLKRYPGAITLFRPRLDQTYVLGAGRVVNKERELVFPDNCWGPWAESLEIIEVSGDHDSMVLEPNVRVMATRLRAVIDRAERGLRALARPEEKDDDSDLQVAVVGDSSATGQANAARS
ncbi:MAG: SDR family NAD(P)-dependent oxidoreductase [Planctomycetota bacterium]